MDGFGTGGGGVITRATGAGCGTTMGAEHCVHLPRAPALSGGAYMRFPQEGQLKTMFDIASLPPCLAVIVFENRLPQRHNVPTLQHRLANPPSINEHARLTVEIREQKLGPGDADGRMLRADVRILEEINVRTRRGPNHHGALEEIELFARERPAEHLEPSGSGKVLDVSDKEARQYPNGRQAHHPADTGLPHLGVEKAVHGVKEQSPDRPADDAANNADGNKFSALE